MASLIASYVKDPDAPVAELEKRLWCTNCPREGILMLPAMVRAQDLELVFFTPQTRDLILRDRAAELRRY